MNTLSAFFLGLLLFTGTVCGAEEDFLKLDLYYKNSCPFCRKVVRFMNEKGIVIGMKDIQREKEIREELLDLTGQTKVPCLRINGVMMHESNDIIDYLNYNIIK